MTKAKRVLEAILDISSEISNLFDRKGFLLRSVQDQLRNIIEALFAFLDRKNLTIDQVNVSGQLAREFNKISAFRRSKIKFESSPNLGPLTAYAVYRYQTDEIIVRINQGSKAFKERDINSILHDIREAILHEWTHKQQQSLKKVDSPKLDTKYGKMSRQLGRGERRQYLNTPEEIMAFAAETAESIINPISFQLRTSSLESRLDDFWKSTGRNSHATKKFLRYVYEFLIKRGIDSKEAAQMINSAAARIKI